MTLSAVGRYVSQVTDHRASACQSKPFQAAVERAFEERSINCSRTYVADVFDPDIFAPYSPREAIVCGRKRVRPNASEAAQRPHVLLAVLLPQQCNEVQTRTDNETDTGHLCFDKCRSARPDIQSHGSQRRGASVPARRPHRTTSRLHRVRLTLIVVAAPRTARIAPRSGRSRSSEEELSDTSCTAGPGLRDSTRSRSRCRQTSQHDLLFA